MSRTAIALSALLAAAVPLADAVADSVTRTFMARPGTRTTFVYAASSGEMATVIIGNPFGGAQQQVDAAVLAALSGSYIGPQVRFTNTPSPQAPAGYEIVVLLDGPPGMAAKTLCTDRARAAPVPSPGSTTVVIAFCAGTTTMSAAAGRTSKIASPDDPAFRTLLLRTMMMVIPTRDQEDEVKR